MDALNLKLSNYEHLKKYIQNIIPDIYDKEADASMQQSSVYAKYHGLCCSILKESVIAENGFTEYEKIQSDPETELALPSSSDFIKITHETLKRISSGLKENALVFFTAFYEKIHRKSNMSFETELIAYTMLFWILRGKSGRIVALPKAKVMAFMFAISPNILPYLYRWLHARRLSLYKRVTIHSPRLDLLETLIDKNIEELEGNGNNTPLLLLSFLEGKNILKSIDGMKGKYIISSGKGNLSDLFDAFSKYALDIRGNGIIFPRRDILFEYILNRKNLEKFAPSTIRKEFGNHSELSWLFENKEPDADF